MVNDCCLSNQSTAFIFNHHSPIVFLVYKMHPQIAQQNWNGRMKSDENFSILVLLLLVNMKIGKISSSVKSDHFV